MDGHRLSWAFGFEFAAGLISGCVALMADALHNTNDAAALVVDIVTAWLLWPMSKGSLNVKAAFLHNLTDAGASVAVLLGGAAVYWLSWNWVDPPLTLGIVGYILHMSFGLLRRASFVLMEGVPSAVDLDEVVTAVEAIEGAVDMHHLHIGELDEHRRALETHIVIAEDRSMSELEFLKAEIKELLIRHFPQHLGDGSRRSGVRALLSFQGRVGDWP